jgi:hypothetical protein
VHLQMLLCTCMLIIHRGIFPALAPCVHFIYCPNTSNGVLLDIDLNTMLHNPNCFCHSCLLDLVQ